MSLFTPIDKSHVTDIVNTPDVSEEECKHIVSEYKETYNISYKDYCKMQRFFLRILYPKQQILNEQFVHNKINKVIVFRNFQYFCDKTIEEAIYLNTKRPHIDKDSMRIHHALSILNTQQINTMLDIRTQSLQYSSIYNYLKQHTEDIMLLFKIKDLDFTIEYSPHIHDMSLLKTTQKIMNSTFGNILSGFSKHIK